MAAAPAITTGGSWVSYSSSQESGNPERFYIRKEQHEHLRYPRVSGIVLLLVEDHTAAAAAAAGAGIGRFEW